MEKIEYSNEKETPPSLENIEKINDKYELGRIEILKNFWERNKGKLTVLTDTIFTGAVTVPLEAIKGSTLDRIPLKGVNRLMYVFLALTKAPTVALYFSPLIGMELEETSTWVKFFSGLGSATLWQIIYLGHKFAMNPDSVADYMKKKTPMFRKLIEWTAENAKKLNLVYEVIEENKDEIEELNNVLSKKIQNSNK